MFSNRAVVGDASYGLHSRYRTSCVAVIVNQDGPKILINSEFGDLCVHAQFLSDTECKFDFMSMHEYFHVPEKRPGN